MLGLFDDPYVDVDAAAATVGRADFVPPAEAAQRAAIALLTAAEYRPGTLPLRRRTAGLRRGHRRRGRRPSTARVVDDPADADVAILRLEAPYEERPVLREFGSTPARWTIRPPNATVCRSPRGADGSRHLPRPAGDPHPFVERSARLANYGAGAAPCST